MKRILYSALTMMALASMTMQAQVRLYEPFTYSDGVITRARDDAHAEVVHDARVHALAIGRLAILGVAVSGFRVHEFLSGDDVCRHRPSVNGFLTHWT